MSVSTASAQRSSGKRCVIALQAASNSRECMNDITAAGEFIEVYPPRRLIFTWGWTHEEAYPPGTTPVVILLLGRLYLRVHGLNRDRTRTLNPYPTTDNAS